MFTEKQKQFSIHVLKKMDNELILKTNEEKIKSLFDKIKFVKEENELIKKTLESYARVDALQKKLIKCNNQRIQRKITRIYLYLQHLFLQDIHPDFIV